MSAVKNLFANLPRDLPHEVVDDLVKSRSVRVERIVSTGQASPDGFWYDQEENEWIVVLKGEAGLWFEGDDRPIPMRAGDHVNIPAHKRHRVEWTASHEPTVWLVVFY